MTDDIIIITASTKAEVAAIRALLIEYQRHIALDLDFQDFGAEIANLAVAYAPPQGRLYLAKAGGEYVGCVAFRPMEEGVCELKRLYVKPAYLNRGIGSALFQQAMKDAKEQGYHTMRLDTLKRFETAGELYRRFGFYEIAPFNRNPYPDVYYLEKKL